MKNPTKYHVLQSQKRQVREFLLDDSISDRGGTTAIVKKPHFLCPPKTAFMPRSAPETSTASGTIHKLRHAKLSLLSNIVFLRRCRILDNKSFNSNRSLGQL